jgi:hypothetical protein
MPELNFRIAGVEPAYHGITPLLHFDLEVINTPAAEVIQSLILQVQIQFQSVRRTYNDQEKDRLKDLFDDPERWGQTLRNRLWTHVQATAGTFGGTTHVTLPVPCTFDLNVAATKYFYALEEGTVPLLFLFSGSIFYTGAGGNLQIQQIPWEKECTYAMPVAAWKSLMDVHYPGSAWIYLQREVFERLYAYKREHHLPNWDAVLDHLLPAPEEVTP